MGDHQLSDIESTEKYLTAHGIAFKVSSIQILSLIFKLFKIFRPCATR